MSQLELPALPYRTWRGDCYNAPYLNFLCSAGKEQYSIKMEVVLQLNEADGGFDITIRQHSFVTKRSSPLPGARYFDHLVLGEGSKQLLRQSAQHLAQRGKPED